MTTTNINITSSFEYVFINARSCLNDIKAVYKKKKKSGLFFLNCITNKLRSPLNTFEKNNNRAVSFVFILCFIVAFFLESVEIFTVTIVIMEEETEIIFHFSEVFPFSWNITNDVLSCAQISSCDRLSFDRCITGPLTAFWLSLWVTTRQSLAVLIFSGTTAQIITGKTGEMGLITVPGVAENI